MILQPSNMTPSVFGGTGEMTVAVADNIDVSWQVSGNSLLSAFQIDFFKNNATSEYVTSTGLVTVSPPFNGVDNKGNPIFYHYSPSVTWTSKGLTDGNTYKYKITQLWDDNMYVYNAGTTINAGNKYFYLNDSDIYYHFKLPEQYTSGCQLIFDKDGLKLLFIKSNKATELTVVTKDTTQGSSYIPFPTTKSSSYNWTVQFAETAFFTRSAPSLSIDTVTSPLTSIKNTFTATYSQSQNDVIRWVKWTLTDNTAHIVLEETPKTITNVLVYAYDGFLNGNNYTLKCEIETEKGVYASDTATFDVAYSVAQAQGTINAECQEDDSILLSWAKAMDIQGVPSSISGYDIINNILYLDEGESITWDEINGEAMDIQPQYSIAWKGSGEIIKTLSNIPNSSGTEKYTGNTNSIAISPTPNADGSYNFVVASDLASAQIRAYTISDTGITYVGVILSSASPYEAKLVKFSPNGSYLAYSRESNNYAWGVFYVNGTSYTNIYEYGSAFDWDIEFSFSADEQYLILNVSGEVPVLYKLTSSSVTWIDEVGSQVGFDYNPCYAVFRPSGSDLDIFAKSPLPIQYQQCEYVESDGNCYITLNRNNTIGATTEKYYIKFSYASWYESITSGVSNFVIGGYASSQSAMNALPRITIVDGVLRGFPGGLEISTNPKIDQIYECTRTLSPTATYSNLKLRFFRHGDGYTSSASRIYQFIYWRNGHIVHYFVPCYRKTDGVIGFYDVVENNFLTNKGSGTLTRGRDINGIEIMSASIASDKITANKIQYVETSVYRPHWLNSDTVILDTILGNRIDVLRLSGTDFTLTDTLTHKHLDMVYNDFDGAIIDGSLYVLNNYTLQQSVILSGIPSKWAGNEYFTLQISGGTSPLIAKGYKNINADIMTVGDLSLVNHFGHIVLKQNNITLAETMLIGGTVSIMAVITDGEQKLYMFDAYGNIVAVEYAHAQYNQTVIDMVKLEGYQEAEYLYITRNRNYDFTANAYTPNYDSDTAFYANFTDGLQAGTYTSSGIINNVLYRSDTQNILTEDIQSSLKWTTTGYTATVTAPIYIIEGIQANVYTLDMRFENLLGVIDNMYVCEVDKDGTNTVVGNLITSGVATGNLIFTTNNGSVYYIQCEIETGYTLDDCLACISYYSLHINRPLVPIATIPTNINQVRDYGTVSNKPYTYQLYYADSSSYSSVIENNNNLITRFTHYTLLEAVADSTIDNVYHVKKAWIFGNNVQASEISNNNTPTFLSNFTKYPFYQPNKQSPKSGTLSALLSNFTRGKYNDTADMMNDLFNLSHTENELFIKDTKGNIYQVRVADAITQTIDNTNEIQPVTFSLPWREVADASKAILIQLPTDEGWRE